MNNLLPEKLLNEFSKLSREEGNIENKLTLWREAVDTAFSFEKLEEFCDLFFQLYQKDPIPIIWTPEENIVNKSNIFSLMRELSIRNYYDLQEWSSKNRETFWEKAIQKTGIKFHTAPDKILDLSKGVENPMWLKGATLNITDSCFQADDEKVAIVQGRENCDSLIKISYNELEEKVNCLASGLLQAGYKTGDHFVLYMPMTIEAVIAYLAIIRAGMVVISVADSFSAVELRKRIEMTNARAIITFDYYIYSGKKLEIYKKVIDSGDTPAIVCSYDSKAVIRSGDVHFNDIFTDDKNFQSVKAKPEDLTNVIFSSGTTKEPKAIPWTHITPIKCASDGYFHQDIHPDDVVCWTTGMGWMMAPWLIYAGLINKATIALYSGSAASDGFGKFAEQAQITILGTIPSVVKVWRASEFHKKFKLKVRLFSSTGEPSNKEDYCYLMGLTKFTAPVIEYCGGTEIGGGYITGSLLLPNAPAAFNSIALGLNFYLLNGEKQLAKENEPGEVFIVPPSIGLTQHLLNRNHHDEYFKDTPSGPQGELLRKHGDAFEIYNVLNTVFYKSVGRTDDAMNLGGIKISAVEIEEAINHHSDVFETAAVSIPAKDSGPEMLVIFYVSEKNPEKETLKSELQKIISAQLNPLFRISEIIKVNAIPRTASNKIMRRELRNKLIEERK
ncbi:MAG: AMP-binding protein [Cytophagaceae bacterium]